MKKLMIAFVLVLLTACVCGAAVKHTPEYKMTDDIISAMHKCLAALETNFVDAPSDSDKELRLDNERALYDSAKALMKPWLDPYTSPDSATASIIVDGIDKMRGTVGRELEAGKEYLAGNLSEDEMDDRATAFIDARADGAKDILDAAKLLLFLLSGPVDKNAKPTDKIKLLVTASEQKLLLAKIDSLFSKSFIKYSDQMTKPDRDAEATVARAASRLRALFAAKTQAEGDAALSLDD